LPDLKKVLNDLEQVEAEKKVRPVQSGKGISLRFDLK
jgi:hypothetical protein